MKKTMLRFLATLLLLVDTIPFIQGCVSSMSAPPLRVGTSPTMAPVVFLDADKKLAGLEVDLGARLSKILGRRIEWVEMPFENLVSALERREIDVVMAGMSITERRQQRVLFTEPYMQAGQMLMFRRSDLGTLNSTRAAHRDGRRFAVQRGSTGSQYVFREFPNATLHYFENTDDMVNALRNEEVDYLVQDAPAIWHYSLNEGADEEELLAFYRYLTTESLAWAVRRDEAELRNQLNAALAKMRADGSLPNAINHWMPVRTALH